MIGADVVDIKRIARAIQSEHFLTSVFTQSERLYTETQQRLFISKKILSRIERKRGRQAQ